MVVPVDHHIFFQFEDGKELYDYDFNTQTLKPVKFADASQWQYFSYRPRHAAVDNSNILHFEYNAHGERLRDGRDYRPSYYSLDVTTGRVGWLADHDWCVFCDRGADGRFVFFQGRNAPISGAKLVSSPYDFVEAEYKDPKGKNAKVLKRY